MNLVVVESPTKTRLLANFLSNEYKVVSTKGHFIDLPKSKLGVDVEHDFAPEYETVKGRKKIADELKRQAKGAGMVYLATDPDREGEAIAYQVARSIVSSQQSTINNQQFPRLVFHEITKSAVLEALGHPRELDMDLVQAQQTRRILDRLVGYKLSPLLWKKIRYGLSAGRVQSVAVRLIVEREREQEKFKSEPYFVLEAGFALVKPVQMASGGEKFEAVLIKFAQRPVFQKHRLKLFAGDYTYTDTIFKEQKEVDEILAELRKQSYSVKSIEKRQIQKNPSPPFTTAALQRAASSQLGMSAKQTMRAAQNLYEAGEITYHRTDSTNLAQSALAALRGFGAEKFGPEALSGKERVYKTKSKVAQEAHEAIRPTDWSEIKNQRAKIKNELGEAEAKLYELIWRRTLATQFKPAVFSVTKILIESENGKFLFEVKGSILEKKGYLEVQQGDSLLPTARSKNNKESPWEDRQVLPDLKQGEKVELVSADGIQKETTPPPRYTEAGLIRDLEKFGIGRPSTYAPIISTIQERGYVAQESGRSFVPQDTGIAVNDLLTLHFPEIVDLQFTAQMEDGLDDIANGVKDWVKYLRNFYNPFEERLEKKEQEIKKGEFNIVEKLGEQCPECGKALEVKLGRFGKFISCSGFPQCKYSRPYLEKIGMTCPDCQKGEVIERRTRKGRIFYGCSRYPDCDWASWDNPLKK